MKRLCALALIAGGVWFAFGPALPRVFFADQLWYFAELRGDTSLAAGLRLHDYAAARQYWSGLDNLPYRPLLFTWMAIANSAFSYHHVWWNAANLVLHVATATALYGCLMAIRPSRLAIVAAVIFAVSRPSADLVFWNHLGGYLLAWMFLLVALRAFVLVTEHDRPAGRQAVVYAAAMTASLLCHEVVAPMAVVGGALLLWRDRVRGRATITRALMFLAPVIVFGVSYLGHLVRVQRTQAATGVRELLGGLVEPRNVVVGMLRAAEAVARWTLEMAMPVLDMRVMGERSFAAIPDAVAAADPLALAANVVLLAGAVALLIKTAAPAALAARRPLAVFLVLMAVIYAALHGISHGRAQLNTTGHYTYFFHLWAVVFGYALVEVRAPGTRARGWAMALLVAIGALEAVNTRHAAAALGMSERRASAYFEAIVAFVDAHRRDPGFRFRIDRPPHDLDPLVTLEQDVPGTPPRLIQMRASEILFSRYYDAARPAHVLDGATLVR